MKTIFYKLSFVGSTRFMASPLSNLVNKFAKEFHKIKCIYGRDNKICETCSIKYKDCDIALNAQALKII